MVEDFKEKKWHKIWKEIWHIILVHRSSLMQITRFFIVFFFEPPVRCNRWEQVQTGHSERNSIVIHWNLIKFAKGWRVSAPSGRNLNLHFHWISIKIDWIILICSNLGPLIEFRRGLQTVRAPVSPIEEILQTHTWSRMGAKEYFDQKMEII